MAKGTTRAILTATGLLSLSLSCGAPSRRDPPRGVVYDTLGDTIVARVLSEGRWGPGATLVPDLTIGGTDEDPNAIFGLIDPAVALLPGGGVIVVDVLGPRILEYSAQGRLVRTFGRKGEGPGEYMYAALGAIEGGKLLVIAPNHGKMIVYDSLAGLVTEWREGPWLSWNTMAVPYSLGRGDGFLVRVVTQRGLPFYYYGFAVLSLEGDTLQWIPAPYPDRPGFLWGFAPFQPQRIVEWHPAGFVVTAYSDAYAIDVLRPEGKVLRITRDWTPVRLHGGEWELWNQSRDFMNARGGRVPYPEVPREKPAFARILIARTGEIWAQRHTSAVLTGPEPKDIVAAGGSRANPWREPLLFDVFEVDGAFLGSVSGPMGVEVRAISGDTVWGVGLSAYGIPQLVRFVVAR